MPGLVGTAILFLVILGCLRLGFWQLERLAERRTYNEWLGARLALPPLTSAAALRDTAAAVYRVVVLRGTFDHGRTIILPGRSLRGAPGVHLVTPLLLEDSAGAVLINRGWLPAADAATVDLTPVSLVDTATVRGLAQHFPGAQQSLATRQAPPAAGDFRRTWYTIDAASLRAQYPYELLPTLVQALPEPEAAGYPVRLRAPALDSGPHLGYALQWFSFGIIAFIGWIALVLRARTGAES